MINSIITEAEFMQMYDCFYARIYNYLYFRLLNKELTEDLLGDVFLKVFEHRAAYNFRMAKLSTWLFTIARNTLLDYFRKKKNIAIWEQLEEETIDIKLDIEKAYIQKDDLEHMQMCLRKLPENYRTAIYLKHFMNFDYREVASHLNISEKSASNLLSRAVQRLKIVYEAEEQKEIANNTVP